MGQFVELYFTILCEGCKLPIDPRMFLALCIPSEENIVERGIWVWAGFYSE